MPPAPDALGDVCSPWAFELSFEIDENFSLFKSCTFSSSFRRVSIACKYCCCGRLPVATGLLAKVSILLSSDCICFTNVSYLIYENTNPIPNVNITTLKTKSLKPNLLIQTFFQNKI